MGRIKQRWKSRPYKALRIVGLLLVAYLVVTRLVSWELVARTNSQAATDRFNAVVQSDVQALQKRFEVYADTLYSGRALFLTKTNVSRQDWTNFVDAQNIKERYPGIDALGYVAALPRSQTAALVAELNRDRLPSEKAPARIWPASQNPTLAVMKYVAPSGHVQKIIGYDLFTSQTRKQTLEKARDAGTPRSSPPLALQGDKTGSAPNFLFVAPVYSRSDLPTGQVKQHDALKGFVVMSLHSQPLLDSVFKTKSPYGKVAVTASSQQQVIYQTGSQPSDKTLQKTVAVDIAGQTWQLDFSAPKNFGLNTTAKFAPLAVIVSTITLVIILAFAFYYAIRLHQLRRFHAGQRDDELKDQRHKHD